jgi:hypothetical protein
MLYQCLNCNTKSNNYYYIKKHINNKNHSVQTICSLCNLEYKKNHYSTCPSITVLLQFFIHS